MTEEQKILKHIWQSLACQSTDVKFLPKEPTVIPVSLDDLRASEWSPEFEQLMRNRLLMGFFRYGPFPIQNRSTKAVMESIILRAEKYIGSGNTEFLVDIANLAMKEFACGNHPNKHFDSLDDGEHV